MSPRGGDRMRRVMIKIRQAEVVRGGVVFNCHGTTWITVCGAVLLCQILEVKDTAQRERTAYTG